MPLWFQNAYGEKKYIANCDTIKEVISWIDAFIDIANEDRAPNCHPFVRTRTNYYEINGVTKINVGSYSEFFIWEGKIN